MEIRQLHSFVKVVEYESFSKAASSLDYAQSTITSHIKQLEEELGAPLFDRLGKKIRLTEVGEHFLQKARQMLELYEESRHIAIPSQNPEGTLTIGAPESLAVYRLPQIMQAFRRSYPHVYLTLKVGDCPDLNEYIQNGEVDVAILLDIDLNTYEDLETELLLKEQMVMVEAPEDIPLQGESSEPTALYTEKGCSYRLLFDDYLLHHQITPHHSMEFWSVEAIKQCVKCGLGIALLPAITVEEEIEHGKLKVQEWSKPGVDVMSILATHKSKWKSPAMKAFMETTREYFQGVNEFDYTKK
ncbi:LysR family transcriptional regulator [Pontibacillus salipaludis]|uniref:LysR family transcriptional regulator n=1 Tax=Pontibacillus salipaludis TaxID=1697394 RepID=A0ABQ1QG38_9BACI|nr:LysR family transcriptional regulator [Pontibacillus salipaludis]GGD25924.1 LysR family transcriptional regulator [Pontibacillus salipaludis]